MKITFEGDYKEIFAAMEYVINKSNSPQEFLNKCKLYADQAAASASGSYTASRNAIMALDDLKNNVVIDLKR